MEEFTVYIFELKNSPGDMYAFTIDKKMKKMFEVQRNMELFKKKKKTVNSTMYSVFSYMNREKMLSLDYLQDEDVNVEIISTTTESNRLTEECEKIELFLREFKRSVYDLDNILDRELLKSIVTLTNNLMYYDTSTLNINTLHLFIHLFKETFSEDWVEDKDERGLKDETRKY